MVILMRDLIYINHYYCIYGILILDKSGYSR